MMTANRTWLHRSVAVCFLCAKADVLMSSGGPKRTECLFFSGEVANIACHPQLDQSGAAALVLLIGVISGLKGG